MQEGYVLVGSAVQEESPVVVEDHYRRGRGAYLQARQEGFDSFSDRCDSQGLGARCCVSSRATVALSDLLSKPSVCRTGKPHGLNSELSGVSHGKLRVWVSLLFGRGGRHIFKAGGLGGFEEFRSLRAKVR